MIERFMALPRGTRIALVVIPAILIAGVIIFAGRTAAKKVEKANTIPTAEPAPTVTGTATPSVSPVPLPVAESDLSATGERSVAIATIVGNSGVSGDTMNADLLEYAATPLVVAGKTVWVPEAGLPATEGNARLSGYTYLATKKIVTTVDKGAEKYFITFHNVAGKGWMADSIVTNSCYQLGLCSQFVNPDEHGGDN